MKKLNEIITGRIIKEKHDLGADELEELIDELRQTINSIESIIEGAAQTVGDRRMYANFQSYALPHMMSIIEGDGGGMDSLNSILEAIREYEMGEPADGEAYEDEDEDY